MTTYHICETESGNKIIVKNGTLWIPSDESNMDYREFIAWCEEGNEPEEWSAE